MKPIPRARSAAIGAVLAVVATLIKAALEPMPETSAPYWLGVALGGALFGVGIGAAANINRR